MTALSTTDKLRLKVSAARVERLKRQALMPVKPMGAKRKIEKAVQHSTMSFGQEKPDEDIKPDRMDDLYRLSDGGRYRSMSGKLGNFGNAIAARVHTINHTDPFTGEVTSQVVHHIEDGISDPNVPIGATGKQGAYVYKPAGKVEPVKARANSPFKNAKAKASSVVIIRKPSL